MQYFLLKPTLETGTLKDVIPLVAISSNKWFFTFLISAIRWSLSLQFCGPWRCYCCSYKVWVGGNVTVS